MIDPLCENVFRDFGIDCFIETGTDKGETVAAVSRWFACQYPEFGAIDDEYIDGARSYTGSSQLIAYPVFSAATKGRYDLHSVDIDETVCRRVERLFISNPNIHIHQASSEEFLKTLLSEDLRTGEPRRRYMFFLDAHWGPYWPLRDELKVITQLSSYLILIDDFLVPGKSNPSLPHGDFGFDVYKGRILNWGYIRDLFSDDVRIFYPERPNRDNRGWVLLARGWQPEQMIFLRQLPLREVVADDPVHAGIVQPTLRTYLDGRNMVKQCVPMSILRRVNAWQDKVTFLLRHRSSSRPV